MTNPPYYRNEDEGTLTPHNIGFSLSPVRDSTTTGGTKFSRFEISESTGIPEYD